MTQIRIQKYLSQSGAASRRHAEELIQEGRVFVNGRRVTEMGVQIDPDKDVVKVGNRVIKPAQKGVILLNKPRGVVCTMSDPEGRPTVAEFLTSKYKSYFPVSRLDYDSTGLVIMTNDGELGELLMHPKHGARKTYEVKVRGRMNEETVAKLEKGVKLADGMAQAEVRILKVEADATALKVVIVEGRNRLIRRMMQQVGHLVKKLKRVSHGPFKLANLQNGQICKLTEREYLEMKKRVIGMVEGSKKTDRR